MCTQLRTEEKETAKHDEYKNEKKEDSPETEDECQRILVRNVEEKTLKTAID